MLGWAGTAPSATHFSTPLASVSATSWTAALSASSQPSSSKMRSSYRSQPKLSARMNSRARHLTEDEAAVREGPCRGETLDIAVRPALAGLDLGLGEFRHVGPLPQLGTGSNGLCVQCAVHGSGDHTRSDDSRRGGDAAARVAQRWQPWVEDAKADEPRANVTASAPYGWAQPKT